MDSTAHAILQARILEWVAVPSPGDLFNPGIQSRSPTLQPYSLSAEPILWWVFYNHFDDRGSYSQSCGFSSSYESWTIRKGECQRTDASKLQCWRTFLRVSWTARRSNQSILKEIIPEYSLEGLMLKRKLQYFAHLMRKANSLGKISLLEKNEGRRRKGGGKGWDGWMASPTQWTQFEQTPGDGEGQGSLVCCSSWGCKQSDTT